MVKRILVPLDPSAYSLAALNMACTLGKKYKAEITGMVILDLPGIERSIGPIPAGAAYYAERLEKTKVNEAQYRCQELLVQFEKKCKKAGVKYKIAERHGRPSTQIIKESLFYDLIIIGIRTFFHFESQDKAGDSLEKLLDDSITPIYAVPENFISSMMTRNDTKVLIAFDGSYPSARALQRFAQFALPPKPVITLLNSNEDKEKSTHLLTEAENYLKCHGFKVIKKVWTDKHIIDVVKNKYYDKTDLIVLGVNSRKGILQFVLGSLTLSLIKKGKKLLLIGQ
jgi:nucleotide-binding universal stress UspA family protein